MEVQGLLFPDKDQNLSEIVDPFSIRMTSSFSLFFTFYLLQGISVLGLYLWIGHGRYWKGLLIASLVGSVGASLELFLHTYNSTTSATTPTPPTSFSGQIFSYSTTLTSATLSTSTLTRSSWPSTVQTWSVGFLSLLEEICWIGCEYSIPFLNFIKLKAFVVHEPSVNYRKYFIGFLFLPFTVLRFGQWYIRWFSLTPGPLLSTPSSTSFFLTFFLSFPFLFTSPSSTSFYFTMYQLCQGMTLILLTLSDMQCTLFILKYARAQSKIQAEVHSPSLSLSLSSSSISPTGSSGSFSLSSPSPFPTNKRVFKKRSNIPEAMKNSCWTLLILVDMVYLLLSILHLIMAFFPRATLLTQILPFLQSCSFLSLLVMAGDALHFKYQVNGGLEPKRFGHFLKSLPQIGPRLGRQKQNHLKVDPRTDQRLSPDQSFEKGNKINQLHVPSDPVQEGKGKRKRISNFPNPLEEGNSRSVASFLS